jgi:CRP-like cAMP-binding protein
VPQINADLLRNHPLVTRLSDEQLERFARAGELELFHPGEDVVVQGTLGDSLYLVVRGRLEVRIAGSERALATLEGGEFFGEMSLLEPAQRSATVRAVEDSVLFRVPQFALANLLQDDPVALNLVLVKIVRVLSERLRRTNQLVGSVDKIAPWLSLV